MLTIIIAVLLGCGGFSAAHWLLDWGWLGSAFAGAGVFLVFQVAFGLFVQKRVKRDMEAVQAILLGGQKRVQAKMQRWQLRPPGSVQEAQREIFEDTKVFVREALAATETLSKYRLWVPMIDRQKATAQLQLCWMIKDFQRVDELMPKALFLDANTVSIRMARMYALGQPSEEIEKVYRKGVRRTRYNGNVLMAAVWSWILVRRGDADGAFKALTEALKNSDDETLKRNHEHLMNNRASHFSNSGLGDQWYALYLEEPKLRAPRQRAAYR